MSALKFRGECNNMLYPREDKETRTLLYTCQSCEHQEIATDTCVYKRVICKPAGEPKDILKDAATDPSLPRTSVKCYNCNYPEVAFFRLVHGRCLPMFTSAVAAKTDECVICTNRMLI